MESEKYSEITDLYSRWRKRFRTLDVAVETNSRNLRLCATKLKNSEIKYRQTYLKNVPWFLIDISEAKFCRASMRASGETQNQKVPFYMNNISLTSPVQNYLEPEK